MIYMEFDHSAFNVIEYNITAHLLELVLVAVHDSDSENELLSIVVIEDTVQVISETLQENKSVSRGNNAVFPLKC